MQVPFSLIGLVLFQSLATAQPILVEATRLDESETHTRQVSQTVLKEAQLNRKIGSPISDVLSDIPGVQTIRQGGIGQTTSVFVRGARSEGTLVLVDGIEANDASSPGGGFDFSTLSINNIERIEIDRAPSGVVYGPGASGGVVKITTKDGLKRKPSLHGQIEHGSYATTRAGLNFLSGSENVGLSYGLAGHKSAGYSAASDGSEADASKSLSGSAKLTWRVNDMSEAVATLRSVQNQGDIDRGGGIQADDPNSQYESKQILSGLSLRRRFLDQRFQTKLAYSRAESRRDQTNDVDSLNRDRSRDSFRGRTTSLRSDNELLVGEDHTMNLGLHWREERANESGEYSGSPARLDEVSSTQFGQSLFWSQLHPNWSWSLGARQDRSTGNGPISVYQASFSHALFSGSIAFAVGRRAKRPSLYQLYSQYGEQGLQGETSTAWELSYERNFSRDLHARVTYFDTQFDQLIDFDSTSSRYQNIASARTSGVETHLRAQMDSKLFADFNHTYLKAKDQSTGLALLRQASHTFGLSVGKTLQPFAILVRYRYKGSRTDKDPVTFQRIEVSSYDVWEIESTWDLSARIRLQARLENILDRRYEEVAGYATARRSGYLSLIGEL